jgi:large subunit ribosomal protein L12
MELVYAALLLHKSGKEINLESIKKVMDAVGSQVDESKIKALVAALDGVDIDQAIKEAVAVGAAPAASGESAPEDKKEDKKEEEKKDEAESAAGLGALFG